MFSWMKRLHMYAGLLTFSALVVWGVAGIHGAFIPHPDDYRPPPVSLTEAVEMRPPAVLDDRELARYIYEHIDIPLRGGHYNIHRDHDSNLAFFVFTASGRRDVTYLENQGVVRIDVRQNDLLSFLSTMHTAHSRRGPATVSARLWGYYNEFSTWAFLFMTLSGVYLWVGSRPHLRWAQLIAAAAVVSSVVLALVTVVLG